MKNIKFRLIGKNSISSLLFWLLIIYLTSIIIILSKMLIAPVKVHLPYDIWATFKLNILYALPQLLLFLVLLLILFVFKSTNIFSKKMISHLNFFAVFCFLMPFIKFLGSYIFFNKDMFDGEYNTALYIFLGVLSIFSASIFKNGFKIQQENDLTI